MAGLYEKKTTKTEVMNSFLFLSFNFHALTPEAKRNTLERMRLLADQYAGMRGASKDKIATMSTVLEQHEAEIATPAVSHLTLTGPLAGRTLCGGQKDPAAQHYHAMYAPAFVFTSPSTCADCLRVWNAAQTEDDDNTLGDYLYPRNADR